MLAELTLRLAFMPERGWPRLAVAHASGEPLPSPLRHAVTAAFLSVIATGVGWSLKPGATYAGTVLQLLAALLGYVGGAALPVMLAPVMSGLGSSSSTAARYASAAVLPVALSGLANMIPLLPLSFALALAGAALSAHSGWIGASAMLALEGQARKRAAAGPTGMAVGLVLTATFVRAVLPP
jgi:hypothetical protein